MNNTDKLLRALIDALGYEVEEVRTPLSDSAISNWNNKWRNANTSNIPSKPTATVDYKVTNKVDKYKEAYEKLKATCLNAAKVKGLIGIMLEHAVDECEEFIK